LIKILLVKVNFVETVGMFLFHLYIFGGSTVENS